MGGNLAYSVDEAQAAAEEWGFNCGPGALTAIADLTPAEIRPLLGGFEKKRYTNPRLMYEILDRLDVEWKRSKIKDFPNFGLARIQWEGPWTEEGKHWAARQRHTHWVACKKSGNEIMIFDVNAVCVGGWISFEEWAGKLVPWLLREVEPEANGKWHITHSIEVKNGWNIN